RRAAALTVGNPAAAHCPAVDHLCAGDRTYVRRLLSHEDGDMTDIVERLRGVSPALGAGTKLCGEAADEIELLRDTLKRHAGDVKDAMQEIERLEGDVKFAKKVMAAKDDEIERLKAEFELFREAP